MKNTKSRLGLWLQSSMQDAVISYETGKPVETVIEERKTAYSRRGFVSDTAKFAVFGAAINAIASCTKSGIDDSSFNSNAAISKQTVQDKSIAIIGAGIAGLNAAITLQEKGISADVYEASERVGGRMFTATNEVGRGLTTELGGEFVNTDHSEMRQLAKKYNLDLIDSNDSDASYAETYFFNGKFYSYEEATKEFLKLLPQIYADKKSISTNVTAFHYTQTDRMFDNMPLPQYMDRIGAQGWFRELLLSLCFSEYGLEPNQQSALNFLFSADVYKKDGKLKIYYSNERYKIEGGNQHLTKLMAADLDKPVQYGYELKKVKSINDQYRVFFTQKDGKTFSADYDIVLFALPFSILRNVELDVPLPAWKKEVIDQHGYGNNSKLVLGFKERFWNKNGLSGDILTDTKLQGGWDSSLLQPGKVGSISIYKGGNEAVILGDGSLQDQVDIHLPLLNDALPGASENYNNKAIRMVWPSNPYSKASYTCYLLGQYTTLYGKQIIPVDNMYFAGEHCSIDYWGYMEGGAETGKAAALQIAKKVKHTNS